MRYTSTRDKSLSLTAAEAITRGLSRDGGLFIPETLPVLPDGALEALCRMRYQERAAYIMGLFLEQFTKEELSAFASAAYDGFDTPAVARVRRMDAGSSCLELWHGPTCAFKDMALQMLPHLLTASLQKTGEPKTVCILVATSGDTGKAALEGFADVKGTKILVFYPEDGVSEIQELQMVTQAGANVGVCAVKGNFDDAQTGVKTIFSNEAVRETLSSRGYFLSSANSINWGRLLPQIVYYISAYCDLVSRNAVAMGEKVNFCVPTGNFGNILSAYYAKQMGLPVGRLLCASNANNVLTDFIRTGVYDRNRPFHNTLSPSMDILVSSNLERLLFTLSGEDDAAVRGWMDALSRAGRYEITPPEKEKLDALFYAGFCDDDETRRAIGALWKEKKYLIDPHTAVAFDVLRRYREETGDTTHTVVVSTASPFKFCDSVLESLGRDVAAKGPALFAALTEYTGVPAPAPLAALAKKSRRFDAVTEKDGMKERVLEFLK